MKKEKIKGIIYLALLFLLMPVTHVGQAAVTLGNPLPVNSLPELINNVIKGLLGIVGAVSLLMVVIGGIQWMTSGGNSERVKRGKDTLVWAILGLVVVFLSYAIINFVFQSLE